MYGFMFTAHTPLLSVYSSNRKNWPNCKKVGQNSCNVLGDSKIRVFVICLSLFNY